MARLLERDEELSVLATAVGRAAEGAGSVVLVGGEAGIGKTSLVRALAERVGAEVSFLLGACEPLSVPVPLAPWREVLDAAGGASSRAMIVGCWHVRCWARCETARRRSW